MTGPEHYARAERALRDAENLYISDERAQCLAVAQVHATLALAATSQPQQVEPYELTETTHRAEVAEAKVEAARQLVGQWRVNNARPGTSRSAYQLRRELADELSAVLDPMPNTTIGTVVEFPQEELVGIAALVVKVESDMWADLNARCVGRDLGRLSGLTVDEALRSGRAQVVGNLNDLFGERNEVPVKADGGFQ